MRINSIAKIMWAPNARQVNVPIIRMRARILWFSSWCKNWHVASCIHADTVRHSARPWYLNIHAIEFSSEMHSSFSRLLICLQRLFCSNSRRACASPYPPAHILPGCTACKYVLRPMLHRQWDFCAAIATASLIRVDPWNAIAVTSLHWKPHAK